MGAPNALLGWQFCFTACYMPRLVACLKRMRSVLVLSGCVLCMCSPSCDLVVNARQNERMLSGTIMRMYTHIYTHMHACTYMLQLVPVHVQGPAPAPCRGHAGVGLRVYVCECVCKLLCTLESNVSLTAGIEWNWRLRLWESKMGKDTLTAALGAGAYRNRYRFGASF